MKNISDNLIKQFVEAARKKLSARSNLQKLELLVQLSEFLKRLGALPSILADSVLKELFPTLIFVFQIIEDVEGNIGKLLKKKNSREFFLIDIFLQPVKKKLTWRWVSKMVRISYSRCLIFSMPYRIVYSR